MRCGKEEGFISTIKEFAIVNQYVAKNKEASQDQWTVSQKWSKGVASITFILCTPLSDPQASVASLFQGSELTDFNE